MAYTKTTWNTGDPITQDRMNHIEDGIAAAQSTADGAVKPTDSVITNLTNNVSSLTTIVGATANDGLRRQVIDLASTVE